MTIWLWLILLAIVIVCIVIVYKVVHKKEKSEEGKPPNDIYPLW